MLDLESPDFPPPPPLVDLEQRDEDECSVPEAMPVEVMGPVMGHEASPAKQTPSIKPPAPSPPPAAAAQRAAAAQLSSMSGKKLLMFMLTADCLCSRLLAAARRCLASQLSAHSGSADSVGH